MPIQSGLPSVIKSIQRGTLTIGPGVGSATATVTAVNMAKSQLNFLGYVAGTASLIEVAPRMVLTNSTTITVDKGSAAGNTFVSWELIEWN